MARQRVWRDQARLLDRLGRLEQQLAQVARARGGGFGTGLLAFALGVVVGGGLALLFAPQRGEEARQRVLELKDQAAQRASQAKDQAAQRASQAKDQASQAVGQAQQAASQLKDRVQSATVPPPSDLPLGASAWRPAPASEHPQG